MNQILETKFFKKTNFKKKFIKIQFITSILFIIILIVILIFYIFSTKHKENISKKITDNYSLYKLYSKSLNNDIEEDKILGIIEIPKINIKYLVFSQLDDELLKIAPCKFYGKSPKENGNLCIAGHNYNNSKFFSNLFLLEIDDEIFIYDNYNKKYDYKIVSIYEVNSSDMSPILEYDKNIKQLTLVTCDNINQNRLIVKAKQ